MVRKCGDDGSVPLLVLRNDGRGTCTVHLPLSTIMQVPLASPVALPVSKYILLWNFRDHTMSNAEFALLLLGVCVLASGVPCTVAIFYLPTVERISNADVGLIENMACEVKGMVPYFLGKDSVGFCPTYRILRSLGQMLRLTVLDACEREDQQKGLRMEWYVRSTGPTRYKVATNRCGT